MNTFLAGAVCVLGIFSTAVHAAGGLLENMIPDLGESWKIAPAQQTLNGAYIDFGNNNHIFVCLEKPSAVCMIHEFGTWNQSLAYQGLSDREKSILEGKFRESKKISSVIDRLRREFDNSGQCSPVVSSYMNGRFVIESTSNAKELIIPWGERLSLSGLGVTCSEEKTSSKKHNNGNRLANKFPSYKCVHSFADGKSKAATLLESDAAFSLMACHNGPYRRGQGGVIVPKQVWLDLYESIPNLKVPERKHVSQWTYPKFRFGKFPVNSSKEKHSAKDLVGKYRCTGGFECKALFEATSSTSGKILELAKDGTPLTPLSCEAAMESSGEPTGSLFEQLFKNFIVRGKSGNGFVTAEYYIQEWDKDEKKCETTHRSAIYRLDTAPSATSNRMKLVRELPTMELNEQWDTLPGERIILQRVPPNLLASPEQKKAEQVDADMFDSFLIWRDGKGLEDSNGLAYYPFRYYSEAASPDEVFFESSEKYWTTKGEGSNGEEFIGKPTEGVSISGGIHSSWKNSGILTYPEKNGRTLILRFTAPEAPNGSEYAHTHHNQTRNFCAEHGLRLPTLREIFDFCVTGTAPSEDGTYGRHRCGPYQLATASLASTNPSEVWIFDGKNGAIGRKDKYDAFGVRCVGAE